MDFEKLYYLLKNEIAKQYDVYRKFNFSDKYVLGNMSCVLYLLSYCDDLEKKTEVINYGN